MITNYHETPYETAISNYLMFNNQKPIDEVLQLDQILFESSELNILTTFYLK